MADDRKINQGVRVANRVITDVDELEKAAGEKDSQVDMQRLLDSGAISGTWKGATKTKEPKTDKEK